MATTVVDRQRRRLSKRRNDSGRRASMPFVETSFVETCLSLSMDSIRLSRCLALFVREKLNVWYNTGTNRRNKYSHPSLAVFLVHPRVSILPMHRYSRYYQSFFATSVAAVAAAAYDMLQPMLVFFLILLLMALLVLVSALSCVSEKKHAAEMENARLKMENARLKHEKEIERLEHAQEIKRLDDNLSQESSRVHNALRNAALVGYKVEDLYHQGRLDDKEASSFRALVHRQQTILREDRYDDNESAGPDDGVTGPNNTGDNGSRTD